MLEEVLSGLAVSGATAAIQAMATDSWETVRAKFAQLFQRLSDRHSTTIAGRLAEDSKRLAAAADAQAVRTDLVREWRTRLVDLLETYPEAVDDLREVIALASEAQPITANAAIFDSAGAEIEDSADNTLGRGQSGATISNSPNARIRRSGNIG